MRLIKSLYSDTQGTALIEGAITVPVLAILLFGVFEFSWLFYKQHLISTGLRDAARYLGRTPYPYNNDSAWLLKAKNLAATGDINNSGVSRVAGWSAENVTCGVDVRNMSLTFNPPTGTSNQVVTCSTTWAPPTLGLFGILGITPETLNVSHSERAIVDWSK